MQAQLSAFDLGPDAALRLDHPIETRLAALFESVDGLAERLMRVQVKDGIPVWLRAGGVPLFDGEKSMWHVWPIVVLLRTTFFDTNFTNRHEMKSFNS